MRRVLVGQGLHKSHPSLFNTLSGKTAFLNLSFLVTTVDAATGAAWVTLSLYLMYFKVCQTLTNIFVFGY